MKYIEGNNRYQPTMLPPILDDYVDENNPTRVIDAFTIQKFVKIVLANELLQNFVLQK